MLFDKGRTGVFFRIVNGQKKYPIMDHGNQNFIFLKYHENNQNCTTTDYEKQFTGHVSRDNKIS